MNKITRSQVDLLRYFYDVLINESNPHIYHAEDYDILIYGRFLHLIQGNPDQHIDITFKGLWAIHTYKYE